MPSCPFVQLILQSKGQKVPKSGSFKNEGIHELINMILSKKRFWKEMMIILAVALLKPIIAYVYKPIIVK